MSGRICRLPDDKIGGDGSQSMTKMLAVAQSGEMHRSPEASRNSSTAEASPRRLERGAFRRFAQRHQSVNARIRLAASAGVFLRGATTARLRFSGRKKQLAAAVMSALVTRASRALILSGLSTCP